MATVSIVVPVYSGENYLRALVEAIFEVRSQWQAEAMPLVLESVVFVDDNCIDRSGEVLDALAAAFPWVEHITLSRNFGQHPATVAGILKTRSDWVVTMDEDLQHPPARILDLLGHAVATGSDLVYGKPASTVHESARRDLSSRGYKYLVEWLTGNPHVRSANSFRLIRGSVARGAAAAMATDVYLDVALHWFTTRVETMTLELKDMRVITGGASGYKMRSLFSHARRLLVSSQIKILRLGALFGLLVTTLSIVFSVAIFAARLIWPDSIDVQGWTSIVLLTAFFGGSLVLMAGIILEYISILLMRSNGRPLFHEVDRRPDAALAEFFAQAFRLAEHAPKGVLGDLRKPTAS
jgi:undecaprenyl-phosphate 4-deoxy-4-formamido-L-arabinose transferase